MRFKWVAFVKQKRRSCTMRHLLNMMSVWYIWPIWERRRHDCYFLMQKLANLNPRLPMPATIKPSIQNKLPHQLPLVTQNITYKITSETYNRVDDATPAPKSVSYDKSLCSCLLKIRWDTKRLFANRTCSFSMLPLIWGGRWQYMVIDKWLENRIATYGE